MVEDDHLFLEICEASLDAVVVQSVRTGQYVLVNRAFERMTGLQRDEILGKTPEEASFWADPSDRDASLGVLLQKGRLTNHEARLRTKQGSVSIALLSEVVATVGNEPCIVSFAREVTERRESEEQLARALAKAEESARLKSVFLATMSHEIRTPLNVIIGYNALIADHLRHTNDQSLLPFLDAIDHASQRLLATVTGMLDYSKIVTGTFEVVLRKLVLGRLLEQQLKQLHDEAVRKGLALTCEIEERATTVLFDEYCLTQALAKLLENAIKFTEDGGLSLRLRRMPDRSLCIEVEDTGIGIDQSYLAHVFQPFSQEDSGSTRRFEGSGLGLTLARSYIELTGGTLSVKSEKGKGSVFRVHIPREREVPSSAQSPEASTKDT